MSENSLIPKPGDLLVFNSFGYCHWAIYSEDSDDTFMIIHVTAADNKPSFEAIMNSLRNKSSKAVVKEELASIFKCFLNTLHVDNTFDSQMDPFPADEILKRARDQIGSWDYDLEKNNCEHFVKWCRYGVKLCQQLFYNYDTDNAIGTGLGSITVGPARYHLPEFSAKYKDEKGQQEIEGGIALAKAEVGPVRGSAGLKAKIGYRDDEGGIGYKAETEFANVRFGEVGAKLGFGVSSGFHEDETSTGFQLLGTGIDVRKDKFGVGVNVLGSRAECSIM